MKFEFPKETLVNQELNIDAFTQLVYGRKFKYINNYISKIKIYAIFNDKTTHLKQGEEIKEFYVIKLFLRRPGLPLELLKRLDSYINFPVFYWLNFNVMNNFVLPVFSEKSEKKQKPLRVFYTGWDEMNNVLYKYKLCSECDTTLDDVYKNLMVYLCGLNVNYHDFTIAEYVEFLKQKIEYLREYSEEMNVFESAYRFSDVKMGSPTFESMKELFFITHDKGINLYLEPSNRIQRYITHLGYKEYTLKFVGTRCVGKELYESLFLLDNIKIDFSGSNLRYELNYDFCGDRSRLIQTNKRFRSDDEIAEMKLLYGKYLIENNYDDIDLKDANNNLTKKRKQRNMMRRKMTAEEMTKYLGE